MDHNVLVEEMRLAECLPLNERIKMIKKRRKQQITNYSKWIKQESFQPIPTTRKHPAKVYFTPDVTLIDLASRNDIEDMKALLKTGVNPDASNHDGLTALHQCCIDGSEALVALLLKAGANVNAQDQDQWTPLHAAATCGHFTVVTMLIRAGADLTALNSDGDLPYDITEDEVTLNYLENEMLKQGITDEIINEKRISEEMQMQGDIETMLQMGQSLDLRGKVGESMLHVAVANGYNSVVQMLLESNASVNLEDEDKWQPIHVAAHWNNLEALELLVDHNANLRALTKFGETPLDLTDDPNIKANILQMIDDRPDLYAMRTHSLHDNSTDICQGKPHKTENLVNKDDITDRVESTHFHDGDAESILKESNDSENDTNLSTVPANPLINKSALEFSSDRRNSMRDAKSKAPLIRGNSIKENPKPQSPNTGGFSSPEPMMPTTLERLNPIYQEVIQNTEIEISSTEESNPIANNESQSTNHSGSKHTQIYDHYTDAKKFTKVDNNNETHSPGSNTYMQSQTTKASHTSNPIMNSQTQWTNPLANNKPATNLQAQKKQLPNSYERGKSEVNPLSAESKLPKQENNQQPTKISKHTSLLTNPLTKNNIEKTKLMSRTQPQPPDSFVNDQLQSMNPLLMKQIEPRNLNSSNQSQHNMPPNSQKHPTNLLLNEEQQIDPPLNPSQLSSTQKNNKTQNSNRPYNYHTVALESHVNDSTLKKQSNGHPVHIPHEKEPDLGTPKKLRPSPKSHRAPDPPKGTLLDLKRQRQLARTFEDVHSHPYSSFNPRLPSSTQVPPHEYPIPRPRSSSAGMKSTREKRAATAQWQIPSNPNTFNPPPSPTAIRYSFKSNPADYILGPSIVTREKKCIIM